jgi:hypothetical protein
MKRIAVVLFAVFAGGCYTQLQVSNDETTSYRPYDPPAPIIIIQPVYPYPPPHPCPDPYPGPPRHPVIMEPTKPVESTPVPIDRPRTEGSTRDENERSHRGGNTGNGRR